MRATRPVSPTSQERQREPVSIRLLPRIQKPGLPGTHGDLGLDVVAQGGRERAAKPQIPATRSGRRWWRGGTVRGLPHGTFIVVTYRAARSAFRPSANGADQRKIQY